MFKMLDSHRVYTRSKDKASPDPLRAPASAYTLILEHKARHTG